MEQQRKPNSKQLTDNTSEKKNNCLKQIDNSQKNTRDGNTTHEYKQRKNTTKKQNIRSGTDMKNKETQTHQTNHR